MHDSMSAPAAATALSYPFQAPPAPGEARQVAPGMLWLRMPLPMAGLNHINVWALADDGGWTLVDTGMQTPQTAAALAERFRRPAAGRPGGTGHLHAHASRSHRHGRLADPPARLPAVDHAARVRDLPHAGGRHRARGAAGRACASIAPPAGMRRRSSIPGALRRLRQGGVRAAGQLPARHRRRGAARSASISGARWSGAATRPNTCACTAPELEVLISGDQVLPRISSNVSVFPTEPDADPLSEWLESLAAIRRARAGRRAGAALAQRAVPRSARAPRRAHRRPRAAPARRCTSCSPHRSARSMCSRAVSPPRRRGHAQHGHRREHRAPQLPDRAAAGGARASMRRA